MAKVKGEEKEGKRKEKQERKQKEKIANKNGVQKAGEKVRTKQSIAAASAGEVDTTTELLDSLESKNPGSIMVKENEDLQIKVKAAPRVGALVPFANPIADEKQQKKTLKSVKKGAKNKTLRRGVKEVVKALRKSPLANASNSTEPNAIIIIAADISPMDVISHIPVLCEDHGVPYIFVPSRVELGAAGNTKRPTSVVMISKTRTAKRNDGEENQDEEWAEAYSDLVKVVIKASRSVKL